MKTIAVYLHNGLADWESGFILPYLREAGCRILTIAETRDPILTMGGFSVLPERAVKDVRWQEITLLLLPGGESWMDHSRNQEILSVVPKLKKDALPIAAICAATVALGRIGLLDNIRHTSNFLAQMKYGAPQYQGEKLYVEALSVSDENVITASGIGALEFSYEILALLRIWDEQKTKEWFEFFKKGIVPANWIP